MRADSRTALSILLVLGAALAPVARASGQQIGGRLTGTVVDSTRNQPLAGAEVVLSGTQLFAVTNEEGRFFIPDVPAGTYAVTFHHARIDSLGIPWPSRSIHLEPGAGADIVLYIPSVVPAPAAPAAPPDTQSASPPPASRPLQLSATGAGGSAFVGSVIDAGTGRPVAGAALEVRGTNVRNVSDERGRFVLWGVPPGQRTIDIEMLGYAKRSETVTAQPGVTAELTVPLSTRAIELDPITVEVRSQYLERTGFYERIETGHQGSFLQRPEIESRGMLTFRDLFTAIPVVRVEYIGEGRSIISLRRTVGSSTGLGCTPYLYLDGSRIVRDWDILTPDLIEGMEVYSGSNTPLGYGNSCGAIMIWTRHGG